MSGPLKLGRREWLRLGLGVGAGGAIGLGLGIFGGQRLERRARTAPPREQPFAPSAFLAIDHEGVTTLWVTRAEMGQGVSTALPLIVADELEADWSRVRFELAPASPVYGNQATMGSASVRSMQEELRVAGAAARAMLTAAAASTWGVSPAVCRALDGAVEHPETGRRLPYGALVALAAELPVPRDPPLKTPDQRRLIGQRVLRLDAPPKVDGSAVYGLDVRRAGMCFASIERPRALGARFTAHDAAAARAVEGVRDVFVLDDGGIAVIADTTWAAFEGRRALAPREDAGPHGSLTSEAIEAALLTRVDRAGAEVRREGDVEAALAAATTRVEGHYVVPYLAHACMEPINATAQLEDGILTVWAPTQHPQRAREEAAERAGVPLERCHLHTTFLGGGFGRRSVPIEVLEAVSLAVRLSPTPVQVVWTREDDLRHDLYRPATAHRIEVGLDAEGRLAAWRERVATPTAQGTMADAGEVDGVVVEGAEPPYAVPALEIEWGDVAAPVPTGIWRSVGHGPNAWAVECAIDEAAVAAGVDPIAFRRAHLDPLSREAVVLGALSSLARWETEGPPPGRARGVALHACFGSVCAMVAEVSRTSGAPRVHRVWAVIDCGLPIHPPTIEAQVEGGIVFGLSAALYGRCRLEGGAIVESNFHDYRLLAIDEMPEIRVHVLDSERPSGGVGEVGVPPIAPAVTNALAALDGARQRRLPLR